MSERILIDAELRDRGKAFDELSGAAEAPAPDYAQICEAGDKFSLLAMTQECALLARLREADRLLSRAQEPLEFCDSDGGVYGGILAYFDIVAGEAEPQ